MTTTAMPRPLASEQTLTAISRAVAFTTLLIAGFAAVLSYEALRLLAVQQGGIDPRLAWMFPLILDGTLAVASGLTLYATLRGQRAAYPWLLVLGFTGCSIAGNIAHGQPTPIGWFIAGLPPLAFALTWHLLLDLRKAEIVRREHEAEAARLAEEREAEKQRRADERAARTTQAQSAPAPRRAPEPSRTPLPVARGPVEPNVAAPVTSTGPARPKVSAELLDQARAIVAAEPDIRAADLAARLGRTEKTGRNALAALRAEAEDLAAVG
jgi:hypothetical protein